MPQQQRKQRREDWKQRAQDMRDQFRSDFSNESRTQYYVGDPAPTPIDAPGGHGQRAQLARKLAARGNMRNQQLYDLVQKTGDLYRPGTGPDANLGGPGGPEPTLTGSMPGVPPDDQMTMFNTNPSPGSGSNFGSGVMPPGYDSPAMAALMRGSMSPGGQNPADVLNFPGMAGSMSPGGGSNFGSGTQQGVVAAGQSPAHTQLYGQMYNPGQQQRRGRRLRGR